MVFGACVKLIGNGILLIGHGNHRATQSTAVLAVSQVLFCFGAFDVVGARVGAQASVPHEDVATVIASLALWSTLGKPAKGNKRNESSIDIFRSKGSSVGYSIATAMWSNLMFDYMVQELPNVPTATITKIYGSIKTLRKYPWASEVRQGGVVAYSRVMGYIFIVSACVAALGLIFALLMPSKSSLDHVPFTWPMLIGMARLLPGQAAKRGDEYRSRW